MSDYTIASAAAICVFNLVPIAMIVVGGLNVHDCPIQSAIPVWMILVGVLDTILAVMQLCLLFCKGARNENPCLKFIDGAFGLANLVLFILGSYWIYSVYSDVQYDEESGENYCNRGAYIFSFVIITSVYVSAGLAIVSACLVGLCLIAVPSRNRR